MSEIVKMSTISSTAFSVFFNRTSAFSCFCRVHRRSHQIQGHRTRSSVSSSSEENTSEHSGEKIKKKGESLQSQGKGTKKLKIPMREPIPDKCDWIGPPDPVSNLRPVIFHKPETETENQKQFRKLREENQTWNQQFWARHNKAFNESKEAFKKAKLSEYAKDSDKKDHQLTAEEMSVFYKAFLDENYRYHVQYNKEWYKRNVSLLWPAFKVAVEKLWTK